MPDATTAATAAVAPPLSRSRSTRGAANPSIIAAASSPALSGNGPITTASPRRSHKRGANLYAQTTGASPSRSSDSSGHNSGAATPHTRSTGTNASSNMKAAAIAAASAAAAANNNTTTATTTAPRASRSQSPLSGISSAADEEDDIGAAAAAEDDPDADVDADGEIDIEIENEGPSSPASDEPRYCVCGGVSYGDMIACDHEACPREWFHLQCVGLTKAPGSKAKWYCDECKEVLRRVGKAVV